MRLKDTIFPHSLHLASATHGATCDFLTLSYAVGTVLARGSLELGILDKYIAHPLPLGESMEEHLAMSKLHAERLHKSKGYKKRLYICAIPQGISGFPKPSIPAIVTGARAVRDFLDPWCGCSLPRTDLALFRLEDGRLPEYQGVEGITEASQYLASHPYSAAYYLID